MVPVGGGGLPDSIFGIGVPIGGWNRTLFKTRKHEKHTLFKTFTCSPQNIPCSTKLVYHFISFLSQIDTKYPIKVKWLEWISIYLLPFKNFNFESVIFCFVPGFCTATQYFFLNYKKFIPCLRHPRLKKGPIPAAHTYHHLYRQ